MWKGRLALQGKTEYIIFADTRYAIVTECITVATCDYFNYNLPEFEIIFFSSD